MLLNDEIFNPSFKMALQNSFRLDKPLLVYVSNDDRLLENIDIAKNFIKQVIPTKVNYNSKDYCYLNQYLIDLPDLRAPSVSLIKDHKLLITITKSQVTKINKLFQQIIPIDEKELEMNIITDVDAVKIDMNVKDDSESKAVLPTVNDILTSTNSASGLSTSLNPSVSLENGKISSDCILSIRLLNGSVLKHLFKPTDTLHSLRNWLDTQSEIEIITTEIIPSFARPDNLHPTSYSFQSPALPRITYSDDQESQTFELLNLIPRAVIILKPIFNEMIQEKRSFSDTVSDNISQLANAIHSFFDYSFNLDDRDNEIEKDITGNIENNDNNSEFIDEKMKVLSINDNIFNKNHNNNSNSGLDKSEIDDVQIRRIDSPSIVHQMSMTKIETVHDKESRISNELKE